MERTLIHSHAEQDLNLYDPLRRRRCFHYIISACTHPETRTQTAGFGDLHASHYTRRVSPAPVDRTGLEPVTTRCFKPPLYHWSYLSIKSPFQNSNLIILITNQVHHHRCLRGVHDLTPTLSKGEGGMQDLLREQDGSNIRHSA
jgi:hypothetical protein